MATITPVFMGRPHYPLVFTVSVTGKMDRWRLRPAHRCFGNLGRLGRALVGARHSLSRCGQCHYCRALCRRRIPQHLRNSRVHERVHVEQFERWGCLFPFVYFIAGVRAQQRGGSFYWDNPYEIEARARAAATRDC
ncbi:hypothetical protein [Thiothrix subterranea]|uniref:hypothetical protein n=1 Tax=Thiothrix subterranea TaxID=2735563 RepID=UPI00280AC34B|nr:hypothetical protein [Thiothrix subterranea]